MPADLFACRRSRRGRLEPRGDPGGFIEQRPARGLVAALEREIGVEQQREGQEDVIADLPAQRGAARGEAVDPP